MAHGVPSWPTIDEGYPVAGDEGRYHLGREAAEGLRLALASKVDGSKNRSVHHHPADPVAPVIMIAGLTAYARSFGILIL